MSDGVRCRGCGERQDTSGRPLAVHPDCPAHGSATNESDQSRYASECDLCETDGHLHTYNCPNNPRASGRSMSARSDYRAWIAVPVAEIDRLRNAEHELDNLRETAGEELGHLEADLAEATELLRRHTMDWGHCDREQCNCSHAAASRFLIERGVQL